MRLNCSGKTSTIFLVIFIVLLVSLVAISVFFFLKEVEMRERAQYEVQQLEVRNTQIQSEIKEARKKIAVLTEKNQEAEKRIESLMEELDLEKGLREEVKKENRKLKETAEVERLKSEETIAALREDVAAKIKQIEALENNVADLRKERETLAVAKADLEKKLKALETPPESPASEESEAGAEEGVELDTIIVAPAQNGQGIVTSVDRDADFVILNLGEDNGLKVGDAVTLMRGEKTLGQVKVTRVLPQMSAADFVPPLTNDQVQKGDRAVLSP